MVSPCNFFSEKGFKIKVKPLTSQQEIIYAKNTRNRNLLITRFENYLETSRTFEKLFVGLIDRTTKIVNRTIRLILGIIVGLIDRTIKLVNRTIRLILNLIDRIINLIDKTIGSIEIFLKKYFPRLYSIIKKIKSRKNEKD